MKAIIKLGLVGVVLACCGGSPGKKYSDELTMKELLTYVSSFDVIHATIPPTRINDSTASYTLGVTDFDNKKILINTSVERGYRPQVLLHELYHVKHLVEGKSQDEALIDSLANVTYNRLYGVE